MQTLQIILSSGIGAGIMAIVLAAVQRYWKKKDDREAKEQVDPKLLTALVAAQKVLMVDRIRYLGSCYIRDHEITLEDKETLHEMHEAYHGLGGNGHLDTVMDEVDKLPVVDRKRGVK